MKVIGIEKGSNIEVIADLYLDTDVEPLLQLEAKDKSTIYIYGEPTMNVTGLVDDAKIEKRG